MLFSVLTRKGKVPRLNLHPPRSRSWLRGGGPCGGRLPCPGAFLQHPGWSSHQCPGPAHEADLSWWRPQGQVPRPRPAVITEETRCPGPNPPQAPQAAQTVVRRPGPTGCNPCRLRLSLGHRGGDGGEVHCHVEAWGGPVDGHGEGSGALQDTAPSLFPGPPSSPAQGRVSWRAPGRRPGSASHRTLLWRTTTLPTVGRAGPLTVAH